MTSRREASPRNYSASLFCPVSGVDHHKLFKLTLYLNTGKKKNQKPWKRLLRTWNSHGVVVCSHRLNSVEIDKNRKKGNHQDWWLRADKIQPWWRTCLWIVQTKKCMHITRLWMNWLVIAINMYIFICKYIYMHVHTDIF